jgi:hypothetical protein
VRDPTYIAEPASSGNSIDDVGMFCRSVIEEKAKRSSSAQFGDAEADGDSFVEAVDNAVGESVDGVALGVGDAISVGVGVAVAVAEGADAGAGVAAAFGGWRTSIERSLISTAHHACAVRRKRTASAAVSLLKSGFQLSSNPN